MTEQQVVQHHEVVQHIDDAALPRERHGGSHALTGGCGDAVTEISRAANAKRSRPNATEQPDGTVLTHEDDRLWGRRFTYQNQRLLYWPLLMSGPTCVVGSSPSPSFSSQTPSPSRPAAA